MIGYNMSASPQVVLSNRSSNWISYLSSWSSRSAILGAVKRSLPISRGIFAALHFSHVRLSGTGNRATASLSFLINSPELTLAV